MDFGLADGAFDALKGPATRQLLRNVLLAESVRRSGAAAEPLFDEAVTVVFARDDDNAAREAVAALAQHRGGLATDVQFIGHGELADVAAAVPELAHWAARFRQRYVGSRTGGPR